VLLSVPKAGRSWLWYFLARYVAARTGGPLDLDQLATGAVIPPTRFLHEHLDVFENAPAPARLLNRDLLLERRVIVLIRDPRDSLVSYWHQKRVRERRSVPDLELFADCPVYGIERISRSTAALLDMYDGHPGEKLLISYEDLVSDRDVGLRAVLRFALAGQEPDERACREALAASSFERMREWERRLTPEESREVYDRRFGADTSVGEDAQFKVRRGRVGTFRAELSPELQRRVSRLPHTRALLERLAARARAGHEQLEVPAPVRGA
jgi:sulfotransferase family protein